jgi:hypothetical protein
VVANKQAQSTSTDRLTTACGRNSRSRHRTDLRSQTTLPKQTQQSRHWAPGEAEAVEFGLLAHRRKARSLASMFALANAAAAIRSVGSG